MADDSEGSRIPASVQWVLMLLPLIVMIFAAGGGWYMLNALQADFDELDELVGAHLLERSQDERRISGLEGDVKRMDRDVIAICAATGAKCKD